MSHPTCKHYGFTLIELLTVISIIAILSGIMFPVLTSAKNSGRRATCQSNLRQLGYAFSLYQDDNHGYWPDQQPYTQAIYKYLKNREVFKCPSDLLRNKLGQPGADDERVSYLRNAWTFLTVSGSSWVAKLVVSSTILHPTRFVALVDDGYTANPGVWSEPTASGAFYAASQTGRHDGQDEYLFADGHVKSLNSTGIADGSVVYDGVTWRPDR